MAIIAVDFDGTLCDHAFPGIGAPRLWLIELLVRLREQGHKVILWTCRMDGGYADGGTSFSLQKAVAFCERYGLQFDAINENLPEVKKAYGDPRKICCDFYIDDRALIWKDKLEQLMGMETEGWNTFGPPISFAE